MTDQLMLEKWSELLRPQFPEGAQFSLKPRKRAMCITWAPEQEPHSRRSLLITFTNLAWKAYRGARAARRSRADLHLEALVCAHLSQPDALQDSAFDSRTGELEISVASVDIFPPTSASSPSAGGSLTAV